MSSEGNYKHDLYKYCENEKDADAIAWAFVAKDKLVKFPFKFPALGPDELRVNIHYVGLCHSDIMHVREYWGKCPFPLVPGHEMVGEVSLVGSDVKDFKKGDLVGFGTLRQACSKCKVCKEGRENLCQNCDDRLTYDKHWGGYATQVQQPAAFFFHIPKGFKMEKAAPLFCAGITTYYPMKRFLKPGMTGGVVGIGGLGHMAVTFLHKLGHHVTAFSSSKDKEKEIKALGADQVVCTKDKAEMEKVANSIDFIINTLPTKSGFEDFIHCCSFGGIFAQVGVGAFGDTCLPLETREIVFKELCVCGSLVGPREAIKEMVKVCAEKDIYPTCEEFPFEELPKAFDHLENGKPKFRVVINIKDFAEKNGWKK